MFLSAALCTINSKLFGHKTLTRCRLLSECRCISLWKGKSAPTHQCIRSVTSWKTSELWCFCSDFCFQKWTFTIDFSWLFGSLPCSWSPSVGVQLLCLYWFITWLISACCVHCVLASGRKNHLNPTAEKLLQVIRKIWVFSFYRSQWRKNRTRLCPQPDWLITVYWRFLNKSLVYCWGENATLNTNQVHIQKLVELVGQKTNQRPKSERRCARCTELTATSPEPRSDEDLCPVQSAASSVQVTAEGWISTDGLTHHMSTLIVSCVSSWCNILRFVSLPAMKLEKWPQKFSINNKWTHSHEMETIF